MKKQLGWALKLGGAESLGISNVGQTVLSRSMESRIWHQLASSVEGGFRKGTMASADLDARHFSFSLCATGVVQAATLVLELRGSESEYRVSPCVSSLRGTAWDSSSFFYQLNPRWFLQLEVMGTYLPGTGTLGWEPGIGLGLLFPKISLLNSYPTHMDVGPAHSASLSLLPLWMYVVSLLP